MTKEILSQLADLAGEHAKRVMIGLRQDLVPTWVLVKEGGDFNVQSTPWQNNLEKEVFGEMIRQKIHDEEIVAYSLVVEAWAAEAPKGWKEGDPHIASREHPQRQEIVVAFATDGKSIQWRRWKTKRNHLEQVIALEPANFDGAQPISWMTELLK